MMELYEQIICQVMIYDIIPKLDIDYEKLVEQRCYRAIQEIYAILSDEKLEDPECFQRIEAIVSVLDNLGIGGGSRHDF